MGEPAKARDAAFDGLKKSPGHPWAMALAGLSLIRDGQRVAGLDYLTRAFAAGPRRPGVWKSLAEGFDAAGDAARAAACRREAAALGGARDAATLISFSGTLDRQGSWRGRVPSSRGPR